MRRLLEFTNYAAQLLALIDIGKTIKHWGTKSNIKKQKERLKNTDDLSLQKSANNTKRETQPTDFSAIALSCCNPYRYSTAYCCGHS